MSCADELLYKLLLRLHSGELGQRYVYIQRANSSVHETIEAVMQLRDLAVLADADGTIAIFGQIKNPMKEVLDVMVDCKRATSVQVSVMLQKSVNIFCNRLNALHRLGLVCRMRDASAVGGGRQYCYVSIL